MRFLGSNKNQNLICTISAHFYYIGTLSLIRGGILDTPARGAEGKSAPSRYFIESILIIMSFSQLLYKI